MLGANAAYNCPPIETSAASSERSVSDDDACGVDKHHKAHQDLDVMPLKHTRMSPRNWRQSGERARHCQSHNRRVQPALMGN